MTRHRFGFIIVCAAILGLAVVVAAGALKVGDIVWAEWTTNGWYHGKIDKTCPAGFHVKFDDGDQKCCSTAQIAKDTPPSANAVSVGTKVLAQWQGGKYYPGTVGSISGGNYAINFDDGDNATVKLSQIRLRN